MIRLFHVSDVHFGAEDRAALDWFGRAVAAEAPDAVIVTGDLTQQARAREFSAAAEWLVSLNRPVTIEVGNHDLPYFNPLARAFMPYRRYQALEKMIERPLDLGGLAVVPLKTTARFQLRLNWARGHVATAGLARTVEMIRSVPQEHLVLVACHHPLIDQPTRTVARTRGGRRALEQLAAAGAHAVLTGHVHEPFDVAHRVGEHTVRLIGAGTLSERVRGAPPSFNELRVEAGTIETIVRSMA